MVKFFSINENTSQTDIVCDTHDEKNNKSSLEKLTQTSQNAEFYSKEKEEIRLKNVYKEALEYQMQSNYSRLISCLEDILLSPALQNNDLEFHLSVIRAASYKLLAHTYRKIGNNEDSYIYYQMAIKLNERDLNLWYGFAITCEQLRQWDNAVCAYEEVLRINPCHWPALDALLLLTYGMMHFERCVQLCQKALTLDPIYEAAVFAMQNIFTFHPSLKEIFKNSFPDLSSILQMEVDPIIAEKVNNKFQSIRSDLQSKRMAQKFAERVDVVNFKSPLKAINWEYFTKAVLDMFNHLKDLNKLESIVNCDSLLTDNELKLFIDPAPENSNRDKEQIEVVKENEMETVVENYCPQLLISNVSRITRNSIQLMESIEESSEKHHYFPDLLRLNMVNDIYTMSNEWLKKYNDSTKIKREVNCQNHHIDTVKYKAKMLTDDPYENVILFIRSLSNRKVTIIEIAKELVFQLVTREHMIWSSDLIDKYLTLSALIRMHFSSQNPESEHETMLSVKRALFETELAVDKKHTELEGKIYTRTYKWTDFISQSDLDTLGNNIMKIQLYHADVFEHELDKVQIRVLWMSYILSELSQNEEEVREKLAFIKNCLLSKEISVMLRPNCVHHSIITPKKIEDNISTTFKSLKIDVLYHMYQNGIYETIIQKTNEIIGTLVLPQDDYSEDINNYLTHMSFNASCYHKMMISAKDGQSIETAKCVEIYQNSLMVLEEITSIMEIISNPRKKNYALLSNQQISFLTDNYYKVAEIVLSNVSILLQMMNERSVKLVDLIDMEEICHFVVLAKEYFYHVMLNKSTRLTAAHAWCLYTHYKCLELFDPAKFNQSVTYNPADEFDLPPSLNFLYIIHEYFGSQNCCDKADGAFLKLIVAAVSEYMDEIRPKFKKSEQYIGNRFDVFSVFDQAVFCMRPIQRPNIYKVRKPLTHVTSTKVTLDLGLMELIYPFLLPERFPEIDSVKSMSVSLEINNFLLEMISLLPESAFADAYSESSIIQMIDNGPPICADIMTGSRYSKVFYLVADHFFKNNEFEKALPYYIQNLRFTPVCFDSWAGIALIYYKRLELKFNLVEDDCEKLEKEVVRRCLNSFNHAISLDPDSMTILIERACFCYEVHSFASRILKKSLTRDISDTVLRDCAQWAMEMLHLAKESYQSALESDTIGVDKEEKWLYFYMVAKCLEKSGESIFHVLNHLERSLSSLNECGAKYIKKIVLYTKVPFRAVEAVEVYYKYHATILKCLLKNKDTIIGKSSSDVKPTVSAAGCSDSSRLHYNSNRYKTLDHNTVLELYQRLIAMTQSPFIVNVGKMKNTKNRKRSNTKSDDNPESAKAARVSPNLGEIPSELRYDDIDDDCIIQEVILPNSEEDTQSIFERCVDLCRNAMEIVLQRLPLHYKAIYHLANIHFQFNHIKDLDKSYDYLMGSNRAGKSMSTGLFKDRKSSNFFYGVWRIPVADIDRHGSFAYHMYRSVNLLLTVLRQLNAWKDLVQVNDSLRKSQSADKRGFLSNADRTMLIRKSLGHAVFSLDERLSKSVVEIYRPDMLCIHTLYQLSIRQSQGRDKMQALFLEAFTRCPFAIDLYRQCDPSFDEHGFDRKLVSLSVLDKILAQVKEGKK